MPLVLGRPGSGDFRITSPVTLVAERGDGVVVNTTGSRYLIGIAGNTYLFDGEPRADEDTIVDTAPLAAGTLPPPLPGDSLRNVSREAIAKLEAHSDETVTAAYPSGFTREAFEDTRTGQRPPPRAAEPPEVTVSLHAPAGRTRAARRRRPR